MAEPDSRDILGQILAPVAADLEAVNGVFEEILRPPTDQVRVLVEHVKRFKGKMLRPALVMFAGRCYSTETGGDIGDEHHKLGAVVELIHVATLVHDDVLDSADMRRGLETVSHRWDNEAAVLLGDYLFATAFALSANLSTRLASRYLSWVTGVVCQGEIAQVVERGNLDLTEETYLDIIEKKTAYLFAASARVGAEYAGAPESGVKALTDYGMKMGTAFQIIDDCLDLEGEEDRVGKTLGTDAGQGKVTMPVLQYLRTAGPADVERMREMLGGGDPSVRGAIRGALVNSGCLAYAQERARGFAREALKCLEHVPACPSRDSLAAIAEFTISRNR
ncbi:MAG: polyprenyl synthetase family protein [Planctomycetota bacterium]